MKKNYFKRFAFYDFTKLIGWWFYLLVFRPKRYYLNKEVKDEIKKFKHKGGALIVSNHNSYSEPAYCQLTLQSRRNFLIGAADIPLNKFTKWISEHFLTIFVNRKNLDLVTFRYIISTLKEGRIVNIFAEGHINENIEIIDKLKNGVTLFAETANVPIIPVYYKNRKSLLERVRIYIGKPIYLDKLELTGKENRDKANEYIRSKLTELLKRSKEN